MEEHIQDTAPHQHPNNIGINKGWGDLGVVKELLEKGQMGKAKLRVELLLGGVHSVVSGFFHMHWIPLYQLNGDTIRKTEAVAKLPLIEKLSGLLQIREYGTRGCPATFPTLPSCVGRGSTPLCKHLEASGRVKRAWHNADS